MITSNQFTDIGERIKRLREDKGLTQAELAKKLNVKRETVNQWENNVRDLKTQYTISLAKEFNVSADYILGITPDIKTTDPTIKEICEYTGLSEKAVREISTLKKFRYYFPCFIKLIESGAMRFIVTHINSFMHDKRDTYKEILKQRCRISSHIKESLLVDPSYDFFDDYKYIDLIIDESEFEQTIDFQTWKFQQDLIKVVNAFIDDYVEKPKELDISFYNFIKGCDPNVVGYTSNDEFYFFDGNKKSFFEEGEN